MGPSTARMPTPRYVPSSAESETMGRYCSKSDVRRNPPFCVDVVADHGCDVALVEGVDAVPGDLSQRLSVVLLDPRLAGRGWPAVRVVDTGSFRKPLQKTPVLDEPQGHPVAQFETFVGQSNGGGDGLVEVYRAPLFERRGEACNGTRDSYGGVAFDVSVVLDGGVGESARQPVGVDRGRDEFVLEFVHVIPGKSRRLHAVIDGTAASAIQEDNHHTAAADAVHERLKDPHGEGGGHGRVDRVAAMSEDVQTHLRAKRVLRRDHAVLRQRSPGEPKRDKTSSCCISLGPDVCRGGYQRHAKAVLSPENHPHCVGLWVSQPGSPREKISGVGA